MAKTKGRRRSTGEGAVYRRQDGRWEAKVDLGWDGPRRRRKSVYGATEAQVLAKLREAQRSAALGVVTDDRVTVTEWLDRWMTEVLPGRVGPSTLDNYRLIADKHIKPALGRKRLSKLTPDDVQRLLRSKETEVRHKGEDGRADLVGYSVSTISRIRAVLAQAIRQAERWGIVTRNVATLTDGPKAIRNEARSLTIDEARALLTSSAGNRLEAAYVVMLSLGLRRGELLGLSWADVDLDLREVNIRRALPARRPGQPLELSNPKAGSQRRLLIPDEVVAALRAHRSRQATERTRLGPAWTDSGLVFTTETGVPIDPRNFHRAMSTISRRAGLGHWHPHELRHSAASIMLAQGVPLEVVSEVLGHASIKMTKDVYGHLIGNQKREAADAMGTALWGA
jgi:integrase